ncbi:MAG: hypothetical protein U0175_34580 [Caldilineaceae bacterium]
MSTWINCIHASSSDKRVPIVITRQPRLRHHRIRADEHANHGVIESGVKILQTRRILLLPCEAVVCAHFAAVALFSVGEVLFVGRRGAEVVGLHDSGTQVVAMQVGQGAAHLHGDLLPVEGIIFGDSRAADVVVIEG